MDIVVRSVLSLVQSVKGYENSVIAGGACRDYVLQAKPKDYDIFIPATLNFNTLKKAIREYVKKDSVQVSKDQYPADIFNVRRFTFEGNTFDLIERRDIENDESFGEKLIDTFNFGINMAYYDGISINTNEHFNRDQQEWTCTWLNCKDLNTEMFKVCEKYNDLKTKYGLRFINKCVKLIKEPVVEQPTVSLGIKRSYFKEDPVLNFAVNDAPVAAAVFDDNF